MVLENLMAQTSLDANFVLAYDTYNQQMDAVEKTYVRSRRSDSSQSTPQPPLSPAPSVLEEDTSLQNFHQTTSASLGTGNKMFRHLVNSLLIGYTAAMVYFMATDKKTN